MLNKLEKTKLIFERGRQHRTGVSLPTLDVPRKHTINKTLLRQKPAELPEVSELDVVRHYVNLSRKNVGIDTCFYPLGSCTMKLNATAEMIPVTWPEFGHLHPFGQLTDRGILPSPEDSPNIGPSSPNPLRTGR